MIERGLIVGPAVLHYGVGRAWLDSEALKKVPGVKAVRDHDLYSHDTSISSKPRGTFDTVVANYVLNVCPPDIRAGVIEELKSLSDNVLVSVRGSGDKVKGEPKYDGVITSRKTFQKLYTSTDAQKLGELLFDGPTMKVVRL